jgi:hypothetical protein
LFQMYLVNMKRPRQVYEINLLKNDQKRKGKIRN